MHRLIIASFLIVIAVWSQVQADDTRCQTLDAACLAQAIIELRPEINESRWQDIVTRDLIISYADMGQLDKARKLLHEIQNKRSSNYSEALHAILSSFVRDGQSTSVFKTLDEHQTPEPALTPYQTKDIYNHAVRAFIAADNYDAALKVAKMGLTGRDQDLAIQSVSLAMAEQDRLNEAITTLQTINNADTRAMTLRAIGMERAENSDYTPDQFKMLFDKLTQTANSIDHLPSQAIAYTYIAMAQSLAGLNDDAIATSKAMTNDALRNKAFAEIAEIQANRGEYTQAFETIKYIDSAPFQNKALRLVSGMATKAGDLEQAFSAASHIRNAYLKAQALQAILSKITAEKTTEHSEE